MTFDSLHLSMICNDFTMMVKFLHRKINTVFWKTFKVEVSLLEIRQKKKQKKTGQLNSQLTTSFCLKYFEKYIYLHQSSYRITNL